MRHKENNLIFEQYQAIFEAKKAKKDKKSKKKMDESVQIEEDKAWHDVEVEQLASDLQAKFDSGELDANDVDAELQRIGVEFGFSTAAAVESKLEELMSPMNDMPLDPDLGDPAADIDAPPPAPEGDIGAPPAI